MKFGALIALLTILNLSVANASELQSFLKHCAYGTLGGAALGVASLALTDKPSQQTSNIAKGASLGLYAGIGYGLYVLNSNGDSQDFMSNHLFFDVLRSENKVDGAALNWSYSF